VGRTLGLELHNFIEGIKTHNQSYSKQAYSKARMKLRHEGYISLNDILLEEYYQRDYRTYKGHRLLGVDGSKIELPHGDLIEQEFGKINHDSSAINGAKAIVVYDLLNELLIDSELSKYNVSERAIALEQFERIKVSGKQMKDIVIADRGFPSLEVFVKLMELGYDFLIRYTGQQFLKETLPLVESSESELEIEISLTEGYARQNNLAIKKLLEEGAPEKIKLRIVKIELSDGKSEYLITSLLSRDEHKIDDFNYLYNLRWNEEVFFNFQKNVVEIEKFSGKTVESIKQDYYSRIFVGSLHALIIEDAQAEIDTEISRDEKLKYSQYKINKTMSFGLLRGSLEELITAKNWHKKYNELVTKIKKHKVPVRNGRTFERLKKGNLKYPNNVRRAI